MEIKRKEKAEAKKKKAKRAREEKRGKRRRRKEAKEEVEKRKEKEKKLPGKMQNNKGHRWCQGKKKMVEQAGRMTAMLAQKVTQPAIEVETLIEAVTSSIEATTPLVSISFALTFCPLCL